MSHNANVPAQDIDDDEPDPVIAKLKKTGCLEKHYAVLECWNDHKDWRKCQNEVHTFRDCMMQHDKSKTEAKSS